MNFLKSIYRFLFVVSDHSKSMQFLTDNGWEKLNESGYFWCKKGLFEIYCGEDFVGFRMFHTDCREVEVSQRYVLDNSDLISFFSVLKKEMNRVGENYRLNSERMCFCALDIES